MFEEIKTLLVDEMAIDEEEIKEDAEFVNDLGFKKQLTLSLFAKISTMLTLKKKR